MREKMINSPGARRVTVTLLGIGLFLALFLAMGTLDAHAAETTVKTDRGSITVAKIRDYGSTTVKATKYSGIDESITIPAKAVIDGEECEIQTVESGFMDGNDTVKTVSFDPAFKGNIGNNAFKDCKTIETVNFSKRIKSVDNGAFSGCTALKNINFDANTNNLILKMQAFDGCTALESVTLPEDVNMQENAFTNCTSLKTVNAEDEGNNLYFSRDGILYKAVYDSEGETYSAELICYPAGKADASYTVSGTIEDVPKALQYSVFEGLPVTKMDAYAFGGTQNLKKVIFPESVTSFDRYIFQDSAVTTVVIKAEKVTLEANCFCNMVSGSHIYAANDTVSEALEPKDTLGYGMPEYYDYYYTADNTTVSVGEPSAEDPEPSKPDPQQPADDKKVSAAVSVKGEGLDDSGNLVYGIYLDSAEYVNNLSMDISFRASDLADGAESIKLSEVSDHFDYVQTDSNGWTADSNGRIKARVLFGQASGKGSEAGFSISEQTKIGQIEITPVKGITGDITMTAANPVVTGITDPTKTPASKNGDAAFSVSEAVNHINSYDVTGDNTVDQRDITEAQRYYQAKNTDDNWNVSHSADVNNDGKVDVQDFIEIFNHIVFNFSN